MDGRRVVPLDAALRLKLNWDVFTFADAATMRRFRSDPLRWCGWLSDPITQRRFRPTWRSPTASYDGRTWWFSSEQSKQAFLAHPDSFVVQKTMLPE